jgi:hypothetical protein
MAAASTFPNLSLCAPEDSMDMSSPAHPAFDGDIDLDFSDGVYGGVPQPDDEQMLTDGEQTRPATATDDMMQDDAQPADAYLHEEEMGDDTVVDQTATQPQYGDEELIDYDDELHEQPQPQPQPEPADAPLQDIDTIDYAQQQSFEPSAEYLEQGGEAHAMQSQDAATQNPKALEAVPVATEVGQDAATDAAEHQAADVVNAEDATTAYPDAEESNVYAPVETHGEAEGQAGEGEYAEADAYGETARGEYAEQDAYDEHVKADFADQEPYAENPEALYTEPEGYAGTGEVTYTEPNAYAETAEAEYAEPDTYADAEPGDSETAEAGVQAREAPLTVNTSLETNIDAPPTPTDTGLHPMALHYGGYIWPLFKSQHEPEGLLKSDNLASLSLNTLIQNCRARLQATVGTVPEVENLMLHVARMDLVLFPVRTCPFPTLMKPLLTLLQNDTPAFQYSLADILQVYLQLRQNDGYSCEEAPPLHLTLAHDQFSSQLEMLKDRANRGFGLEYYGVNDGQEPEGQVGDEYEELGAEGEEQGQAEHVATEQELEEYQQYAEAAEGITDVEGEVQHYQDWQHHYTAAEDEVQEYGEETFEETTADAEDPALAGQETEELQVHQAEPTTSDMPAKTSLATAGEDAHANENAGTEAQAQTGQAASNASSATLNGDQLYDTTGEYEEIHWDDDVPLIRAASDRAEDNSTFPTQSVVDHPDTTGEYEEIDWDDDVPLIRAASELHGRPEDNSTIPAEPVADHPDTLEQTKGTTETTGECDELIDWDDDLPLIRPASEQTHPEFHENQDNADYLDFTEQFDPDDEIGYNEDTPQEAEAREAARKASQPDLKAVVSGSPPAKRTFDDSFDEEEIDFGEPSPKKAKAV